MYHKYTADKVFLDDNELHSDVVIITDDAGKIIAIEKASDHDAVTIKHAGAMLLPGFINTHCHLELSHMKDVAPTGTGLLPFLKTVVGLRDVDQDFIMQCIADADRYMYESGIVAVGDISNKTDTAVTKSKSKIDYYTFVEMFDFMSPAMTDSTIEQYETVLEGQSDAGNNRKSFVPHAPYTVTPRLFDYINNHNTKGSTISIHNQETAHENAMFIDKTGGFVEFFKGFGNDLSHFEATGKPSIHYTLEHLAPDFKTIMVHNTMTTKDDIAAVKKWGGETYWATCPNANLYIENRLPDYSVFIDSNATVTIGTDSLTSNWQLSIWEEIKTIRRYQSYVPLELCLQWATINGAKALGYEDRLGSLTVGKTPGIVGVTSDNKVSRVI